MLRAYVFEKVAVLVFPWHEPMDPPERGARVEVRMRPDEPQRGSPSAAERFVIDEPVFRADLFDQTDSPPGNLKSAHFHPHFDGVEPSSRYWADEVQADPTGWLTAQLSDLESLLDRSNIDAGNAPWLAADAVAVRETVPEIVAAVEATWAAVRTPAPVS